MLLKRKASVLWAAAIMLLTVLMSSGMAMAIVNGNPDGNSHPNVGALVDNSGVYCSGTLISPTVLLTAAHCAPTKGTTALVTFETAYTQGSTTYSGTFHADPSFNTGGQRDKDPHDMAVVVFDKPLSISPAGLPKLNSLSNLKKGTQFTAVGYGATSSSATDYGVRRYGMLSLSSTSTYYLGLSQNANQNNGGTCYGDSGGPNFLGPTEAAMTISGDANCVSKTSALRLDTQTARNFLGQYVTLP